MCSFLWSSGVVWSPGSSSASTAGDGANKSNFEEYLMSLRLSERCHKVSLWYAESMKNSDYRYEAWYKKLMDGCPEKYFDVDSIAALHFNNRGEAYPRNIYNTKSFEETIMSEPLRSRSAEFFFKKKKKKIKNLTIHPSIFVFSSIIEFSSSLSQFLSFLFIFFFIFVLIFTVYIIPPYSIFYNFQAIVSMK
ncbi:hypothetical protein ACJIZ3_015493 [Penstemon smallii]|uniref:Uncharacterized protein n=1 Tax=Penstemon smallii TaxID=265156 RepID=A0ABD3RMS5_9LAMI